MHINVTGEFSVTYQLDLDPAEIARSREQVRKVLPGWGLGEHVHATELILGELATNAQRHSICPIKVNLFYDHNDLWIEVWDSSDSLPSLQQPTADDEMGRGLQIVDYLLEEYGGVRGVVREFAYQGKIVYVVIPMEPSSLGRDVRPAAGAGLDGWARAGQE
jgi:anti-sigma regulatory factor (Ser/Thr protein kinase)